jgi:hypothetical protein
MGHAVVELDKILVLVHVVVRAPDVKTLGVLLKSLVAWKGDKISIRSSSRFGQVSYDR